MPTFKGFVRAVQADARRGERAAKRKQRELENRRKQIAKMAELEQAAYEVELFENHLDVLTSIHADCGPEWDWKRVKSTLPPLKPQRENFSEHESKAQLLLDSFSPSFSDKLLRKADAKRAELQSAVEAAKRKDSDAFRQAAEEYGRRYSEWESARQIAERILDGDVEAYTEAIRHADPFSEISQLGSSIEFSVESKSLICARLKVNSERVIPKETKSLLKSGKLSVKSMTQTKFYAYYQDYVCGAVLRIARELFALLPVDMVIVTALGDILNPQNGHMEERPILSVAIPRTTAETLNFEQVDPSDSMQNFVHNMNFAKTQGFRVVEELDSDQFQSSK